MRTLFEHIYTGMPTIFKTLYGEENHILSKVFVPCKWLCNYWNNCAMSSCAFAIMLLPVTAAFLFEIIAATDGSLVVVLPLIFYVLYLVL